MFIITLVNKDNSITLDLIKKKTTDLFNNENTSLKRNDIINFTFIIERKNNILKMNNILKQEIEIINYEGIISIDEISIITNRTCEKGWALKNNECIINIPFLKPNECYSLLMATSKKIIKYILVKGSIKTDIFISFLNELYNENPYYTYLIDNAAIHKNKKTKEFYKTNNINIVYNALYTQDKKF